LSRQVASYSFEIPLIVKQITPPIAEDIEKLAAQIEALTTVLENLKKGGTLPPAAIERTCRLSL
jgi:hypothetical protein